MFVKVLLLNVEYRVQGQDYVTLHHSEEKKGDITETLVANGLLFVEKKKEKRLAQLVHQYVAAA